MGAGTPRSVAVTRAFPPPPLLRRWARMRSVAWKGLFKSCGAAERGRDRRAEGAAREGVGEPLGAGSSSPFLRLSKERQTPRREIKQKASGGPGADSTATAMGSSSPQRRPY